MVIGGSFRCPSAGNNTIAKGVNRTALSSSTGSQEFVYITLRALVNV